ncbi:MAG: hypothetical protein HGA90_06450 [Alphaproteobacteria bacterium]|nr:hypothetical protein [Alphaproteobacteria bacterium]
MTHGSSAQIDLAIRLYTDSTSKSLTNRGWHMLMDSCAQGYAKKIVAAKTPEGCPNLLDALFNETLSSQKPLSHHSSSNLSRKRAAALLVLLAKDSLLKNEDRAVIESLRAHPLFLNSMNSLVKSNNSLLWGYALVLCPEHPDFRILGILPKSLHPSRQNTLPFIQKIGQTPALCSTVG